METVIQVERLHKNYGAVTAVADVTFAVRRGEIFGILGPNGAGKTTTVECLQGLRSRDGGTVDVLGLDPDRDADRLRRRIGCQLQSSALPDRLRVEEAITLFASRFRPGRRTEGATTAVDIQSTMETWGLASLRRRAYGALSPGQQQRLFLALALLGDPELVFLDELTTGLDPVARRATWELVRQVRDRGATVVLVTHVMEEAEALCDRVAIVDSGRIVALDTPQRLAAQYGGAVRTSFTAGAHDVTFLQQVTGVESLTINGDRATVTGTGPATVAIAAALAGRGIFPGDFRTHHPTLEDVFLSLTGRRLDVGA